MTDWKWKYFKPEEVLSPESYDLYKLSGLLLIQPRLLDKLTELRERIGEPLLINHSGLKYRGFRTHEENQKISKSAKFSQHQYGLACDVTVRSMTVIELADHAEAVGFTGIFLYPISHFVHMDLRTNLNKKVTRKFNE